MKLASIRRDSGSALTFERPSGGVAILSELYALAKLGLAPDNLQALIDRGPAEKAKLRIAIAEKGDSVPALPSEQIDWLAPQPRTGKILGIAVNNRHLNRMAFREPTHPMIFMKSSTALTGHDKPIEIMEEHGYTIPEPEIAAVIGKTGRNIPEAEALDYVFGYTITNDITASGIKFTMDSVALDIGAKNLRPHHTIWRRKFGDEDNFLLFTYHSRSKASDTFAPMGPWLTFAEDIRDPNALAVKSWVDGQLYTEDSTANYLFPIQRCIAEASRFFTLEAGDIMHFGTAGAGTNQFPNGNRDVNLFLRDGAKVEIEIEGLGRLANWVRRC